MTSNPWFNLHLDRRIEDAIRDERNRADSRLESYIASTVNHKLSGNLEMALSRVNLVCDQKIRELMDQKDFSTLKTNISSQALQRYDLFEQKLRQDFMDAETRRSQRLDATQSRMTDVENSLSSTFWGGCAFGIGATILTSWLSKKA